MNEPSAAGKRPGPWTGQGPAVYEVGETCKGDLAWCISLISICDVIPGTFVWAAFLIYPSTPRMVAPIPHLSQRFRRSALHDLCKSFRTS